MDADVWSALAPLLVLVPLLWMVMSGRLVPRHVLGQKEPTKASSWLEDRAQERQASLREWEASYLDAVMSASRDEDEKWAIYMHRRNGVPVEITADGRVRSRVPRGPGGSSTAVGRAMLTAAEARGIRASGRARLEVKDGAVGPLTLAAYRLAAYRQAYLNAAYITPRGDWCECESDGYHHYHPRTEH